MTFKMTKDESDILTLAFKIRDVTHGSDPKTVDAAMAVCAALNEADREKANDPSNFGEQFIGGLQDAVEKFKSSFESGMPPPWMTNDKKDEPPPSKTAGPSGPLSPEEIKALNEEDEPNVK